MIEYRLEGYDGFYSLSYSDLREKYNEFVAMSDYEFKEKCVAALHLACVICFLKEIPTQYCLSDRGIVHELVHWLHIGDNNTTSFSDIRELYKTQLQLA